MTQKSDLHSPEKQPLSAGFQNTGVLVAEDNVTSCIVVLAILKKMGMTAHSVTDGLEAVDAVKTASYDLVLMDVQMPGMDGLEATRKIRQWEEERKAASWDGQGDQRHSPIPAAGNRLPIIAMTAHTQQQELDRCLEAGMDDTITKPFSRRILEEILEKWLSRSKEK